MKGRGIWSCPPPIEWTCFGKSLMKRFAYEWLNLEVAPDAAANYW